ncbi:MAG: 6,7-dimethyl-8-ribityllumazine synthase [Candidatus Micrarchaeota archaeon]|nr:6,7-dimethyl-8-ribityllumazine synthase [Candidatus Micrarchaeota archaeon]MDE1847829.1 6,7-dimethyl-8-ribityllumazine synthase [Candidatus Micrarchaeota archaeon]MDE1864365.1 6,7-dimethyl-8-ribityllumazine synthase [Candidatus Micrarchaeota archaeon]
MIVMAIKIGIVVAQFNDEITLKMLDAALEKAGELGIEVFCISKVPGVFDMPLIVDALLSKKEIDAVVMLGAVIKGDTKHDELIANSTANAIAMISVKRGKPVALGITGPDMTHSQAEQRIKPSAQRAVEAAKRMVEEMQKI